MNWNNVFDYLRAEKKENNQAANGQVSNETGKLTNQGVMNELVNNFEKKLVEVSFDEVVTFPMSFTVIMHNDDFEQVKDYAPLLARQAVKAFYKVIDSHMTENSICENLATYWNICFVPCVGEDSEMNGQAIYVEKGRIQTLSAVHDTVLNKDGTEKKGGSTFTVTVSGSTFFGEVNINKEALKNLVLVSETHLQIPWNRTPGETEGKAEENGKAAGISVAKIFTQGKVFTMQNGTYMVSGSAETRHEPNIFRVNSDYVMNGHIRIQYIEKDNKFKIAAFFDTTLNGNEMPKSNPSDIRWMDLENDATILLADDVEMTFKTLI